MSGKRSRFSTFIAELRRRHVFRVAIAYAAVAWVLMQGADITFPAFGLPEWTITLLVMLLVAGFPLAVVLAWAYDITPAGVERTTSEPAGEAARPDPARRSTSERPRSRPTRSIAALPFVNLNRESTDDYFSDGLTEELINALTRVRGLRVAARTSAFSFKGSPLDVRQIGERLEVQHVLEGSVRAAGDKLRMSVQLINVDDGYCLWSETFERKLGDVFAIQEEIAHAVVGRIMAGPPGNGTMLSPGHAGAPAAALQPQRSETRPERAGGFVERTSNLDAFHAYLKGRYFWNRRTEADLRRAIDHFRQAIVADPNYALAYSGLADSYTILLDHGLVSPQEALPAATKAAERALTLDATLAEAHTSVALVRVFDWQWAGAEDAFRQAILINPGYPIAHHRHALLLAWLGRSAEALEQIEEARQLDPLSLIILASIGWVHYYGRRFDQAEEQLRATLEMEPNFANAHLALGLVHGAAGRLAEAWAELERARSISGDTAPLLALLAHAYGRAGRSEDAQALIRQLSARAGESYVSCYYRALPYLGLGEVDRALDWLERAVRERAAALVYLKVDPIWDLVRDDRRFQDVLERLKFS